VETVPYRIILPFWKLSLSLQTRPINLVAVVVCEEEKAREAVSIEEAQPA
jgi:hypothetical protein